MMLIPIFVFLVWWLFLIAVRNMEWRLAFLKTSLIWGLAMVVITEALSILKWIKPRPVLISWTLAGILPAILLVLQVRRSSPMAFIISSWRDGIRRVQETPGGFFYCALITINALAVLVIGLTSPPNNYDSLVYHMARVANWYANQSVAHYVTAQQLENYFGPCAEFAILQFYVLGGGNDVLANCVQWFAFIGSIIAASLCARELGGRSASQFLAAAFVATIPMALHQANSTQNDLVCGYFVLVTAFFLLNAIARTQTVDVLYAGLSCGLALATKGTAYPLLVPMLVAFGIWLLSQGQIPGMLKSGAILLACILLVNGGWWLRNYEYWGRPLGPRLAGIVNNPRSVAALESNLIRNAALQLTSHNRKLDAKLDRAVRRLHQICNLDIDAPGTTYEAPFRFPSFLLAYHEDCAANPFHFVLMLLIAATWPVLLKKRIVPLSSKYDVAIQIGLFGCVLCSALLFCLLFKYQPYGTRLQLPLFLLGAAPVGVAIGELSVHDGNGRFGGVFFSAALFTATWLFISSLPHILYNIRRPLVKNEVEVKSVFSTAREEQYWVDFPDLYMPSVTVMKALKNMTGYSANGKALSVGILNPQQLEYPFWHIARHEGINAKFRFLGRTSIFGPAPLNKLDAIIVLNRDTASSDIQIGLGSFREVYASPKARLLTQTASK